MNNTQLLKITNLSKYFIQSENKLTIFSNTSFQFDQNCSYGLMASSGVGKSTLLHMIAGIDHDFTGTIELPAQASSVSLVLQQPCLIAELTVLENVMLKKIIAGNLTDADRAHGLTLLDEVGLHGKAHSYPYMLSGGQQQKVSILRALFIPPSFLLADEPTGNLDSSSAGIVIDLLLHYHKKYVVGLIVSTHDEAVAKRCDHIINIHGQTLQLHTSPTNQSKPKMSRPLSSSSAQAEDPSSVAP